MRIKLCNFFCFRSGLRQRRRQHRRERQRLLRAGDADQAQVRTRRDALLRHADRDVRRHVLARKPRRLPASRHDGLHPVLLRRGRAFDALRAQQEVVRLRGQAAPVVAAEP